MITEEKIYLTGLTKEQLAELVGSEVERRLHSITAASTVDEKKPLSVAEAATFLGIARQTVYNGTSAGSIPHHKQGNKLFFFRDELLGWIRNQQSGSRRA